MVKKDKLSVQVDKDLEGGMYPSAGLPFGAMSPVNLTGHMGMSPLSPMSAFSPIGTATSPTLSPVGRDILSQMAPRPFSPFTGTALGPPLGNGTMPYGRPLVPPFTPPGMNVPGMLSPSMMSAPLTGMNMMGPGMMGPGMMGPGIMGPGMRPGMIPNYDQMTATAVAPGAIGPVVTGTPVVTTVAKSPGGIVTITGSPSAVKAASVSLASPSATSASALSASSPGTIPPAPVPAPPVPAPPVPAPPVPAAPGPATPVPATPVPATPVPATPVYTGPPVYENVTDGAALTSLSLDGAGTILVEKHVQNTKNSGAIEPAVLLFKSKASGKYRHLVGKSINNETPEITARRHAALSSLNLVTLRYLKLNRKLNDKPAFVDVDKYRAYVVVMDNGSLKYQNYLHNMRLYGSRGIKIDGHWNETNDLKWFPVSEIKKVMGNPGNVDCVDATGEKHTIDKLTMGALRGVFNNGLLDTTLLYPSYANATFDRGDVNIYLRGSNVVVLNDKQYTMNPMGGMSGMGGYGMSGMSGMGGYGMSGMSGMSGMGGMGGYGMTMM